MKKRELCALTVEEAAPLLRSREISPVELTRAVLDRIEELDPKLNAFTTVCREEAERRAAEAEREIRSGFYRGPLHGIPIGVKDLYDTAGIRTTYGSGMFRDHVPERDSHIVTRLKEAGAVIVGKTATHELGLGLTTNNYFFGPTRNPWNLDHVPGGSSGGSGAAVAADLCLAATGSDGGGSIRFPSVWCGCFGLKPTVGLVSNRGEFGREGSSLAVAGPIAKSVPDLAILLRAMAGFDPEDPWSMRVPVPNYFEELDRDLDELRVGVYPEHFGVSLDPDVECAYRAALASLEALGAEIAPVRFPHAEKVLGALFTAMGAEGLPWFRELERTRKLEFGPETEPLVAMARAFTIEDIVRGSVDRRLVTRDWELVFHAVDVVVLPTAPIPAPRIGEEKRVVDGTEVWLPEICARFTAPANLAGLPAVAVPAGLSAEGLPVGVQFVGSRFSEARLLALAQRFVEAAPGLRELRSPLSAWRPRRP
ncbi:MAG: amidase [Candidatus Binatia bacterium]|nr:MAG: amidase [Candidatus Binatia bacterium]